jgi:hypothetical protein
MAKKLKISQVIIICIITFGFCMANSRVFAAESLQNIALGKSYTLTPAPNYSNCTDLGDSTQLTDGIYTTKFFWTQKSTVGWTSAKTVIITIDLGSVKSISGISFNTAAGAGNAQWPATIDILVSDDGNTYYNQGDLIVKSSKNAIPPAQGYAIYKFSTNELEAHGRYVQLLIKPLGTFCFTDEIEVYKGQDSWLTKPNVGESSSGGLDYFNYNMATDCTRTRLCLDADDAKNAVNISGLNITDKAHLLNQLSDLKDQIDNLQHIDSSTYNTTMPMNNIQTQIFSVVGEMRRLQGKLKLQAWVSNRYDDLSPTQEPDDNSKKEMSVSMMNNEWRYSTLNLTNSSTTPLNLSLKITGLPSEENSVYISVYQVEWTDTGINKPIASALTEIKPDNDGYTVNVPAGMLRQIWFSFHPKSISAGNYNGQVIIAENKNELAAIPITFQVFPLTFPQKPSLHFGGWDYTDATINGVNNTNRSMLVEYLQNYFVDSPWSTSSLMPMGSFDTNGNMSRPSTQNFDNWINLWPNAGQYCVFMYVEKSVSYAKADMTKPDFENKVKAWADFWTEYAGQKGISPDKFVLHLVDEPGTDAQDETIIKWANAIKAAQPKFNIFVDLTGIKATGETQSIHDQMISSVDIVCPNRYILLLDPAFRSYVSGFSNLDIYSCHGPTELMDPYSYARLQAWTCWDMGAKSSFFWSFSDNGGGDLWQAYTLSRNNYAPFFFTNHSLISSKSMEAMREGIEDYEYLNMLKAELAKSSPDNPYYSNASQLLIDAASRVLNATGADKIPLSTSKDKGIADEVNLDILKAITNLKFGSAIKSASLNVNNGSAGGISGGGTYIGNGASTTGISSNTTGSEIGSVNTESNAQSKDDTIKVKIDAVKKGQTLEAVITDELAKDIISQISSNSSSKIILEISDPSNVSRLEVTMPANMLEAAKKNRIQNIETLSKIASIDMAPGTIPLQYDDCITLIVNKVDNKIDLSKQQKKIIGSNAAYDVSAVIRKKNSEIQKVKILNRSLRINMPYNLKNGQDPEKLTVFYIDDRGKIENKAGRYNSKTETISFSTNHFSRYFIKENLITYKDIKTSPARRHIEVMASKGIVGGMSVNCFNPNDKITRAQLIAWLVKELNMLDLRAQYNFKDVSSEKWYYKAVASAYKSGLISGGAGKAFNPNGKVSRQYAITLAAKAIKIRKNKLVYLSVKFDKLNENATRADAAEIVYAAFNQI